MQESFEVNPIEPTNNEENKPKKKKKVGDIIFYSVMGLLCALLITIIFLNIFVYTTVVVDGASMNNTLSSGDVLVCNKKATAKRGDVIVIEVTSGTIKKLLIKRVIGLEGDHIVIDGDGYVYRNDEKLDEPYANGMTYPTPLTNKIDVTLTSGQVFFLGDNRGNSKDSRDSSYSVQNVSQIIGVVSQTAINCKGFTTGFFKVITFGNISNCQKSG